MKRAKLIDYLQDLEMIRRDEMMNEIIRDKIIELEHCITEILIVELGKKQDAS